MKAICMSPEAGSGQGHGFDVVFKIDDMALMIKIRIRFSPEAGKETMMVMVLMLRAVMQLVMTIIYCRL